MIFLISLALAVLFVLTCDKALKKHSTIFYILTVLVAAVSAFISFGGISVPRFVSTWILPIFARAGFAGALFVIVMVTGAIPNGSKLIKKLMPIRGELSIIASILTIAHNIIYGKTYFRMLFKNPARLPINQLAAAICSVIMIVIMLPLFVTSFKSVRKRMNGKTWKKLQRFAYGFYALLYVHIMLLTVPYAIDGRSFYRLTVFVYSAIFISYLICRILKASAMKSKKTNSLPKMQKIAIIIAVVVSLVFALSLSAIGKSADEVETSSEIETSDTESQEEVAENEDSEAETEEISTEDTDSEENEEAPVEETPAEDGTQPEENEEETTTETVPQEPEKNEVAENTTAQTSSTTTTTSTETTTQTTTSSESASQTTTATETQTTTTTTTTDTAKEQESEKTTESEKTSEPEIVRTYKDGTFTGTGVGMNGNITVSVTIKDDVITDVSIVSASDDEPYFSDAKSVINTIISRNSANVDTVSGATWSSGGIIDAVAAALKSAKN